MTANEADFKNANIVKWLAGLTREAWSCLGKTRKKKSRKARNADHRTRREKSIA